MTRREEIIAEAKKHEYDWGVDVDRFDVPDIFAEGAKWADKTMIEKACKWLYVYYPTLERSKSAEDAWNKFMKAMEG